MITTSTNTTDLHEAYTVSSNDLHATLTMSTPDGVYRACIRRNAYDNQSYGYVERFDGAQWHKVHRVDIQDLGAYRYAWPYGAEKINGWEPVFRADMETILSTARSFTQHATA